MMRQYWKMAIFLGSVALLLSGCGQPAAVVPPTDTSTPVEIIATDTATIPTTTITLTPTITRTPTITLTPSRTLTPSETPIPTIDSTQLPDVLKTSISLETAEPLDGHNLRRITGWASGLHQFQWLDSQHLMIYPLLEKHTSLEMPRESFYSAVIVMNIDTGKTWQPSRDPWLSGDFVGIMEMQFLPRWVPKLGALLAYTPERAIGMYDLDGNLIKSYDGVLLGISPSGTKMLVQTKSAQENRRGDSVWIDLLTDKRVDFPWQRVPMLSEQVPVWSLDEMQIYTGYHLYGNAQTGEVFEMEGTNVEGQNANLLYTHAHAKWILGGKYLMPVDWFFMRDGEPGFIGVFDPKAKTYLNVSERAGLPFELDDLPNSHPCRQPSFGGGRYLWVNCQEGGYVVDLGTFTSQIFLDYKESEGQDANIDDWSADGSFAWVRKPHDTNDPGIKILSGASKTLKPMPEGADCATWHPSKNIFLYLSNGGKTLVVFDPQRMTIQKKVDLSMAFSCADWTFAGDKIMLFGDGKNVWQVNYPGLNNLQQLPAPILDRPRMSWSPDGAYIAYLDGADIYIFDVKPNPTK